MESRVGHRVLLRSERIVLLHSFKACNVLLHSFFAFLATYEIQKSDAFFSFEHKRTQRMQRSFEKNVKERKELNVLMQKNTERCVLLKRAHAQPSFFFVFSIYI